MEIRELLTNFMCLELARFYSTVCMVRTPSEIDLVHQNGTLETFVVQFLCILLHDEMRLGVWSTQPHKIHPDPSHSTGSL